MTVLTSWLGAFFYAMAQLVLPLGSLGRRLACSFLGRSLAFRPHEAAARGYLDYLSALSLVEHGEAEAGLRLLRRAERALPRDPAIALDNGVTMAICGEYAPAATHLQHLLGQHPRVAREPHLWFALSWSQLRSGQPSKALESVRQAAGHVPMSPRLQLVHALASAQTGGRLEPASVLRVLRAQPSLLPQLLEFTEHLAASGKPGLAGELVAGLPSDLQRRGVRLIALSALNSESLAAAHWAVDQLGRLGPPESGDLVLQSGMQLRRGDLASALELARQAAELGHGQSAAAEAQWGEALLWAGQAAEAAAHLERALTLGSLSALVGGVVALRLLDEGQLAEARRVFRRERRGDALGCTYAHCATAHIRLAEGDLPEAARLLEAAWREYGALPGWTVSYPGHADLGTRMRQLASVCEAAAREAGNEGLELRIRRLEGPSEGHGSAP